VADRTETLTATKSLEEATQAGIETLQSLGLTVTQTAPGTLEAKAGSALMTYWIGLYMSHKSMPVKVAYTVADNGASRTINMHIKSSVFLAWYTWKFKKRANELADALSQGVSAKLGEAAPQPVS